MPREPEPSTIEKTFILNALKEGIRTDGRSFNDFRPISISFGEEYGMADVRLGKTRYLPPAPSHPPHHSPNPNTLNPLQIQNRTPQD
jgi:exosome complex RNA-binding protein Rrp42 (RNase PH superfamily)